MYINSFLGTKGGQYKQAVFIYRFDSMSNIPLDGSAKWCPFKQTAFIYSQVIFRVGFLHNGRRNLSHPPLHPHPPIKIPFILRPGIIDIPFIFIFNINIPQF